MCSGAANSSKLLLNSSARYAGLSILFLSLTSQVEKLEREKSALESYCLGWPYEQMGRMSNRQFVPRHLRA